MNDNNDTDQPLPTFDDFWTLWPRKMARKDAERAWSRLGGADQVAALTALVEWRRVWLGRGELDYVPYPATWLNGERWTDELPRGVVPRARAEPDAPLPARSAMPAHVRDAIAKLRGRA